MPHIAGYAKDVRYYIEGQTAEIIIPVFGSPVPKCTWLRNGVALTNDGPTYKMFRDRSSNERLEILVPSEKDEGPYEIVAENEHGRAVHEFYLQQADAPIFLEPLKETATVRSAESVQLLCKVDGIPYPEVKFYKDWRLLTESSRIKIRHHEPDTWIVTITGCIVRDSGLYTCTAKNIAGGKLNFLKFGYKCLRGARTYSTQAKIYEIQTKHNPGPSFYTLEPLFYLCGFRP
jgi:hypothetical protein